MEVISRRGGKGILIQSNQIKIPGLGDISPALKYLAMPPGSRDQIREIWILAAFQAQMGPCFLEADRLLGRESEQSQ